MPEDPTPDPASSPSSPDVAHAAVAPSAAEPTPPPLSSSDSAQPAATPAGPEKAVPSATEPAGATRRPADRREEQRDWSQATPGGYHWGTGRRKTAVARVRIRPGAGEFKINARDADVHFAREVDRQTIRAPLKAAELLGKLDVFVNISGGGTSGQAGAIALGIARAINHYDPQYEHTLRDGGYLTRDSRRVERKKYGQRGARRRFQFSKR